MGLTDTKALSLGAYFASAFSITLKHYVKLVSYAFLISAYFSSVAITYHFIDFDKMPALLSVLMVAWFIMMPLLGGYLHYHEKAILGKQSGIGQSFFAGFSKILPLVGALIGLLIVPSLVAGIGLVGAVFAFHKEMAPLGWGLCVLTSFMVLIFSNNRILSLFIVFLRNLDSVNALAHNKKIVKGAFTRTLFRSTLAFVLLVLSFTSALWLNLLMTTDLHTNIIQIIGAAVNITLIGPFLWSMVIVDLQDLEKNQTHSKPEGQRERKQKIVEPISKQKQLKDEDYF